VIYFHPLRIDEFSGILLCMMAVLGVSFNGSDR